MIAGFGELGFDMPGFDGEGFIIVGFDEPGGLMVATGLNVVGLGDEKTGFLVGCMGFFIGAVGFVVVTLLLRVVCVGFLTGGNFVVCIVVPEGFIIGF